MRPWVKHTIGVTVTSVVIFVAALLMATVSVLSVREHSITDGHAGPMQFLAALLEVPFVVLTFPTTLSPPGTWLDSTSYSSRYMFRRSSVVVTLRGMDQLLRRVRCLGLSHD